MGLGRVSRARRIGIDNSHQTTAGRGSSHADMIHSKLACTDHHNPNCFVQNSMTLSLCTILANAEGGHLNLGRNKLHGVNRFKIERSMAKSLVFLLLALYPALAQQPQTAQNTQQVTIDAIAVEGHSRLTQQSIVRLSALKVGQTVTEKEVFAACQRIGDSGLVTNVEYAYEAYPDKPGIKLVLTPHDQLPLVPARIKITGIDEEEAWKWLQNVDPLFTRELPRTEKALALYAHSIDQFLDTKNRPERARADIDGDDAGKVSLITFKAVKLREVPRTTVR